ncbi:MAG: SDR family oxidoreductase [Bacteroidota bacterium]
MKISELFDVKGKIAIITGGSRGIGLMIARGYVENGMKVYITSRKAAVCDAVAAELSKIGECISIPGDMSTDEGRKAFVEAFKSREDNLDILVNNAGAAWGQPFDQYGGDGYDKVMNINVRGLFFLTRDLMPLLENGASKSNPARVINIGSIDGLRVSKMENFAYGPSKAAVHHMTKELAMHLGKRGVTVNAVAPGPFESKMTAAVLEHFKAQVEASCPLSRIGKPEDMAGIALFLASPCASYLNGTVIPVDGGIHLA